RSFEEIGRVTHSNLYRESLLRVAENAKAGGTISDVLEQYPNLYPEHVVGTVRAGEAGGFLPDAAQQVANQAEEAHKFKRFFWFMWLVSGNALLVIPLILAVRVALLEAFDGVINGPNVPSFLGVLIKNLIWPFGPTTILLYLVLLAIRAALSTYEARKFRHEMGLRVPVLGPRARNESVTIFSWAMSKLAKGGMPPYRMWSMAADAVPNLAMKERLLRAGSQLHAGSRISEAVFGSKLFPEEYAPVLSTGELTGDITGALDQMASATRADYDAQTAYAKFRGIGCGCTVVAVVYGIIIIVLSKTYYQDMISKALEAIGEP
ncbi:MAG TPA: type II secretion system F family protein, partial [Fimbriimonadaceae bacterium]|nr:type II secretion system F family protein [Fimbriimonadaceae bacterium]